MKKYFLFLFIGFSISLFSQNQIKKSTDSLLYLIKEIKENKQLSQDVKENYATKIIALINNKHDSLKFKANIEIALLYFRKRDLDSLKKYSLLAEKDANRLKDLYKIQKSHFYLATYYKYQEMPDSAYYHYEQSKNILLKLGDSITAGRRMLNIGVIQQYQQDLLGAEETTIRALKYLEASNLNKIKADLFTTLGNVAQQRNEYEEALKYYNMCLHYLNKSKENDKVTSSRLIYYNNTALVYEAKREYEKGISILKKGLLVSDLERKFPLTFTNLLERLTVANKALGNQKNLLKNYNKIVKIRKKINDLKGLGRVYNLLGKHYKDLGNTAKAIQYVKEGLKYSKQSKKYNTHLISLNLMSKLIKGEEGKNYLRRYIYLSDSIYMVERNMKNQFAKIRYETDKKEQENLVLKSDNEKKQAQLEREKLQKTIGLISSVGALALLGLSFLVYRNRRKRLLFQTQLEKAEVREKERQKIAKSLHDEVAGDLRNLHQKLENSQQFEVAKNLDQVKENVRNLSHQLSSVNFEEVSFKDQIINLISDYFSPSFKIKASGIDDVNWQKIDNPIKRTLYLSIREAIQNTIKYAEASQVNLDFAGIKKEVHLSIQDNGKGFDIEAIKKGIGLKNLQERVTELNGTVSIESSSEKGTNIKIILPLNV
ncbi:MAG: ATP-binding protein [Flavobacteriaceae bacterium]